MPLDPKKLSPAAQKRLAKEILAFKAAHEPRPWETQARNKQLPPDHPLHSLPWTHPKTGEVYSCGCNGNNPEWTTWIFMAGRGTGKTLAGAQWALAMALSEPNIYVGVCAPTFIHVRKTCFEDLQSGILACALPGEITEVNKNNLQITLRNGSIIQGFSAENADSVRGSNLSYCWFDELASIKFTRFFDYGLKPALRIKPKNNDPRLMITTTPTKLRLIRDLVEQAEKDTRRFHITTASSNENPYFAEGALEDLRRQYKGTYLEQQELEGRLVLGSDGALFSIENFCDFRIYPEDLPELRRIVVAIDPASTSSETSDETGIVVAGEGAGHHYYILEDCSLRGSPKKCMETVANAYHRWEADLVVGENTVGDYMPELLAKEDPNIPYKSVAAMKGKYIRAEPVSHIATAGRMHMVGDSFELLEKQLSSMTPDIDRSRQHDDRADACLASGTMVLTSSGEIPIENVQVDDLVWTRAGWKPVRAARCTRHNAEVMTMTMSDGCELTATPDHRIWTENRGWCRMDTLMYGDTLSAWKNHQPRSFTGAFSTGATRRAQDEVTGFTTSITAPGRSLSPICTAKSGKIPIPARSFLMDGISITRTRIRSTTILPILFSLLPASTLMFIPETDLISRSTWRGSARLLRNGMPQKTGMSGMSSTGSAPGKGVNLTMIASACNAGKDSSASGTEAGTVPVNASTGHTASLIGTMSGYRARSAGKSSGRTVTATDPGPAPVSVVSVYASSERKDVYDLSVADIHEFTANGIIVHNCIWAMVELSRRSSASFKEMYGFFPCPKCGEDVNQVMDKTCRHCGESVSPQKEEKIRDRGTRWAGAYKKTCMKGHEYPMHLEECPECRTAPGTYLAQVARFTGNGSAMSYTNRDWLAGMRKK